MSAAPYSPVADWIAEATTAGAGRFRDLVSGEIAAVTRASDKTARGADGRIYDVPEDTLAVEPWSLHHPGGRGYAAIIEESRTNYLRNSYFSLVYESGKAQSWSLWRSSTLPEYTWEVVDSPVYGNAYRLGQEFDGNGTWVCNQTSTADTFAPGETATTSMHLSRIVQEGALSKRELHARAFDATGGVLLGVVSTDVTGEGRVSATYTDLPEGTNRVMSQLLVSCTSAPASWSVDISTAQLEKGAFPTSYIPTLADAVTRDADVVPFSLTGMPVATGAIAAVCSGAGETAVKPVALFDMTSGSARLAVDTLTPTATIEPDGSATSGDVVADIASVVGMTWAAGSLKAYTDGTPGIEDTTVTVPSGDVTSALLGSDGVDYYNGSIQRVTVYDIALSDAQMADLTVLKDGPHLLAAAPVIGIGAVERGKTLSLRVPLYDEDGIPTHGAPALYVSQDGGTFADATNPASAITGYGCVIELTASEMDADSVVALLEEGDTRQQVITIVTSRAAPTNPLLDDDPRLDNLDEAVSAAKTLTSEYDHVKDDVLTPLAVIGGVMDGIAADYAKTGEAASAAATLGSPLQADDERIATLALEASVQEVAAAVAGLEPADLGTDTCTLTILSAAGEVVTDARVFVSADATGTVRSAVRVTNALGQVTFDLTDGETFYVWRYSSTVDFSGDNPQEFVAIED